MPGPRLTSPSPHADFGGKRALQPPSHTPPTQSLSKASGVWGPVWARGQPHEGWDAPFSLPPSALATASWAGIPSPVLALSLQDVLAILPVGSPLTSSISSSITSSLAATPPSPAGTSSVPGMNANALPFYPTSDTVESVIGNQAVSVAKSRRGSGGRDARCPE